MQYLIGLSIIHLLLILGYWIFLKEESQYQRMRTYLIGSTLLALLIPFLHLPSLWQHFSKPTAEAGELMTYVLNPANIAARIPAEETSGLSVFIWGYLMITGWFLFHIGKNIFHLLEIKRSSICAEIEEITIQKVPLLSNTFTFFNWIFVDQNITETPEENLPILRHEQAHVKLGHSYDLLFFELFRAFFWWLPSAWYIRKEIKKIHEYQADAYALKSYSIDQYSSILISSTLKSKGLSLASSFHDGLIIKRLKAMKKNVTKIKTWKLSLLAALGVLLFTTIACNEELDAEIKKLSQDNNMITFDQLPETMQNELADVKESLSFSKVSLGENDEFSSSEYLRDIDPEIIYSIHVDKANKEIFLALKKDGVYFDHISEQSKLEDEVFTLVEEQPRYEGGMETLYKLVSGNLNYPAEARKAGIEGRVYVQFVVDKDGSLTNVETVKGIGGGCDEEAVRVLQLSSGNWTPGEQRGKAVKVRMVLPIIFQLSSEANKATVIVDEVELSPENQIAVNAKFEKGQWQGTVYDEAGKPLPGVSIVEEGTSTGTVSDLLGNFKLIPEDESNGIVLSFVGFNSVRLTKK